MERAEAALILYLKPTPQQRKKLVALNQQALDRMGEKHTNQVNQREAQRELSALVKALAMHLDPDEAREAMQKALTSMNSADRSTVIALAYAVAALVPRLESTEAGLAATRQTLQSLDKAKDLDTLYGLSAALEALAPHLDVSQSQIATRQVLHAIAKTSGAPYQQDTFTGALAALMVKPNPKTVRASNLSCNCGWRQWPFPRGIGCIGSSRGGRAAPCRGDSRNNNW